jgi:hypothetical protein
MLPAARGKDLRSSCQILVFIVYVRTCGTFMSDVDIITNEKHFQEHKVVVTSNFNPLELKVNHLA